MDQHQFINGVRSLFNIDGFQLPELDRAEQRAFMIDPVSYLIRASDAHQDAIWREVSKRQVVDPGSAISDAFLAGWNAACDSNDAGHPGREDLAFEQYAETLV